MATEEDVSQVIAMLGAAFANFSPTQEAVETYFQFLRDLPADALRAATAYCITEQDREFAPNAGQIRGAVIELQHQVESLPSPFQAWEEVCRTIVDVGSYRVPKFSHPLIEQAVNALGWRNLCMSENQIADRARFIEAYKQFTSQKDKKTMMHPLVRGYIEQARSRQLPTPEQGTKALDKGKAKNQPDTGAKD